MAHKEIVSFLGGFAQGAANGLHGVVIDANIKAQVADDIFQFGVGADRANDPAA